MLNKVLVVIFFAAFFVIILPSTNSMCEEELLSKKLIINGKYFSMGTDAKTTFKKIGTQIDQMFEKNIPRVFVKNMILLTAAEIALSYSIKPSGLSGLPITINSNHIVLGFMKYDTVDGHKCVTTTRIINGKTVFFYDLFTFTSDVDKARFLLPNKNNWSATFENPESFTSFISKYNKNRMTSPMSIAFGDGLAKGVYYKFEGLLWFLKASLAFQKKPAEIEKEVTEIIKRLKLNIK